MITSPSLFRYLQCHPSLLTELPFPPSFSLSATASIYFALDHGAVNPYIWVGPCDLIVPLGLRCGDNQRRSTREGKEENIRKEEKEEGGG